MIFSLFSQLILTTALVTIFPWDVEFQKPSYDKIIAAVSAGRRESVFQTADVAAPTKRDPTRLGVLTTAKSAFVMDRRSGAALYEKNIYEPRSIGSVTKLMTALVFLETQPTLDSRVSIEREDVQIGGVQHLPVSEIVTVKDMLFASLVSSDNSATAALVRLSGLSFGDFVARMNERAAEIGMQQTTFVDATGLSSNNRSIVTDIARLIHAAAEESLIVEATQLASTVIQSASGVSRELASTNDLLFSFVNHFPYQIVVAKTGFLPEADYCFGSLFRYDGEREIIVVVLGAESNAGRFQDVKSLAVWTYDVYEW